MSNWLERMLLSAIALGLALFVFGWVLVPTAVPLLPAAVLVAYGALARIGSRTIYRSNAKTLRITTIFGLLGAAVLVPSLLVEYAGKTVNNLAMIVPVLFLWLLAGLASARLTGRLRDAAASSTLSAMISSLANVIALLASYYVLRGSALQERFFQTEGDYEDFARSGMQDFNTWVIGDLFGGTFIHLMLGALVGALLGTLAGIGVIVHTRLLPRNGR